VISATTNISKEVCKLADIKQMVHGSKIDVDTSEKGFKGTFPKFELVTSHIGTQVICDK
jgi:hypothetical protein